MVTRRQQLGRVFWSLRVIALGCILLSVFGLALLLLGEQPVSPVLVELELYVMFVGLGLTGVVFVVDTYLKSDSSHG